MSTTKLRAVTDCSKARPQKQEKSLLPSLSVVYIHVYTMSKNVPSLACYNFDTCERIFMFFSAEMLSIIKRCFTMPPQISCASALPGKTGKHVNFIFFTQMLS